MKNVLHAWSTGVAINPAMLRRFLIAAATALFALPIIALCFAGYLTPAAMFSVLSGIAFCG